MEVPFLGGASEARGDGLGRVEAFIPFSVFGFQFSVKKIININKLSRWFVALG
jgi:hypothetical protein